MDNSDRERANRKEEAKHANESVRCPRVLGVRAHASSNDRGQTNDGRHACAASAPAHSRARWMHGKNRAASMVAATLAAVCLLGGANAGFGVASGEEAADGAAASGVAAAATSSSSNEQGATETNDVPKTEVVYARLAEDGTLQNTYVVNTLEPDETGTLYDFGSYERVQNLTNSSELHTTDQMVSVAIDEETKGMPFSYQGDMGAVALPWNVSVTYFLDGNPVCADELGGATGSLEVRIAITRNADAHDQAFFDNYLTTATITLGSEVARNIQAPDAQVALSGSDTQLTFMVMPGKEKTFGFTADVTDFEMSGLQVAAIPFAIAFDFPDTNALISQFTQLTEAAKTLDAAASALATGADDLAFGMADLENAATGVAQGASEVAQGLSAYQQGISAQAAQLLAAADALGSETEVEEGYEQALDDYLTAFTQAFSQTYAQVYAQTYGPAYAQAYQQALQDGADEQSAMQRAAQQASETAAGAASGDAAVAARAAAADKEEPMRQALTVLASRAAYEASATALQGAASGLGSFSDEKSLLGGAFSMASGLDEFAQGVDDAASGASTYAQGSQEFSSGMNAFQSETSGLPDAVQEEMDALMADYDKSDFVPRSFVSSKNTNVKLVQFVMSAPEIVAPSEKEEPATEQQEQSPFDRLLALFQ